MKITIKRLKQLINEEIETSKQAIGIKHMSRVVNRFLKGMKSPMSLDSSGSKPKAFGTFIDDEGFEASLVDNKDGTFSVQTQIGNSDPDEIGRSTTPEELAKMNHSTSYYED